MILKSPSTTWSSAPLGQLLVDVQSGFASGERSSNGVVQLRMNNVTTSGNLDWTSILRVPATTGQVEKYQIRPGDVMFNSTNSPDLVGKTVVFSGYREPVVFSNHFLRLRVDKRRLDPRYLARWLLWQWQQRIFERLCTTWVNQAAVRKENLLDLEIPLPPLAEQRRIAAILAKADRLRRLRRYALELSESYLQAVFLEMFGDPATNPRGWDIFPLSELAKKIDYGVTASSVAKQVGPKFLRITDIQDGIVKWEQVPYCAIPDHEAKKYALERGDIVFARTGATTGKSFLIQSCPKNAVFASYLIRVKPSNCINAFYLSGYFQSPAYWSQILESASGSAQPGVNATKLAELKIPLPPLSLQQQFAHIVQKHERLRVQQREAARQAEHLFQTLLHRAFNDELGSSLETVADEGLSQSSISEDLTDELVGVVEQRRLPLE